MKNYRIKPLLAAIGAVAILLSGTLPAKADIKSDASNYLLKELVGGRYLDGFTPGTPDFGFSLEALLQLSQYANTRNQLGAAKNYLLNNSKIVGSARTNGYIFEPKTTTLNPAAAAKFAFVSAIVKTNNRSNRAEIVKLLASPKTNQLEKSNGSTFAYAWVVLALEANLKPKSADRLAKSLVSLQRADGGFAIDSTENSTASSTDATGIALQAMGALLNSGTSHAKAIKASIAKAVRYLNSTKVDDHWNAFGDIDVNGTAYALMGLRAVDKKVSYGIVWLKSLASKTDGGISTPWSNGAGDRFATAQSLLILKNLSYANLIRN